MSTPAEKYELITRNLQEVLGKDIITSILETRSLKVYWGTATTGRPHIGYYVSIAKIADLLKAGCEVNLLLADLHAYLDNQKAPWEILEKRREYYRIIMTEMLKSVNVPIDKLKFKVGLEYQLTEKYSLDVYKLLGITTEHDARKAGAEVVKQVKNPLLSGLVYPLLQALDEEYLDVDCQLGGTDQRKIFIYAEKYLPLIGYKKRAHLMNFMLPGFTGSKMSSSEANTKIDILDDPETVRKKVDKSFCEQGNIDENPLLKFAKYVILPCGELINKDYKFAIERDEKYGGNLFFKDYDSLETSFKNREIHPSDLKKAVAKEILKLTSGAREAFSSPENIAIMNSAYPESVNGVKKSKPVKKPVTSS